MPAAAIARDLGLPRSTTYHLLAVLADEGFVVHLPEERRYGLGVAAFELGSAYTRQEPLQRIARPAARPARRPRPAQSAHLAVLHGRDVLYVVEERARRPAAAGDRRRRAAARPPDAPAAGRCWPRCRAAQVRALFPVPRRLRAAATASGPASLPALRAAARATCDATATPTEDGEVTPGFASVASAVLDHTGHPVAGVAVTYPVHEVTEADRGALATRVTAAAHELSRRIRGRDPRRAGADPGAARAGVPARA